MNIPYVGAAGIFMHHIYEKFTMGTHCHFVGVSQDMKFSIAVFLVSFISDSMRTMRSIKSPSLGLFSELKCLINMT